MSIKDHDLNEDYTINLSGSYYDNDDETGEQHTGEYTIVSGSITKTHKVNTIPLRFYALGPFNIRGQSVDNHYKTFLGKQK